MSSPYFSRRSETLFCEKVSLKQLATDWGTPLYVYSQSAITEAYNNYDKGFVQHPHQIHYAMKANSNGAILKVLAQLGAGFDTVSEGEIRRALRTGVEAKKIVFSGVAKTKSEMTFALKAGIGCFNVESIPEMDRLNEVALSLGLCARVSVRCNPNVDPKTHPYISTGLKNNKFGVAYEDTVELYRHAATLKGLEIIGIDAHIGSQITTLSPFVDAFDKLLDLVQILKAEGIALEHIDIGGGLGIDYETSDTPPSPQTLIQALLKRLEHYGLSHLKICIEPGRSIVGQSGALLCEVQYLKKGESKNYAIVDAGMNDMLRPALYTAWMNIEPVIKRPGAPLTVDIVGPVCESSDWLGKDRSLAIEEGDILAMLDAGAYGMSMASSYNSRRQPAEIMVSDDKVTLIRQRQSFEDLWKDEIDLHN